MARLSHVKCKSLLAARQSVYQFKRALSVLGAPEFVLFSLAHLYDFHSGGSHVKPSDIAVFFHAGEQGRSIEGLNLAEDFKLRRLDLNVICQQLLAH